VISIANLKRVAQNRKFDAISDMAARKAALNATEANSGEARLRSGLVPHERPTRRTLEHTSRLHYQALQ